MNALRTIETAGGEAYIDFRLKEIRLTTAPSIGISFGDLTKAMKAEIRGIRAEVGPNHYIEGLDDDPQDDAEHYACWHCGYTGCDCE